MNDSLRPQILPPPHTHLTRMVVASVVCGVTTAAVAIGVTAMPVRETAAPVVQMPLAQAAIAMPEINAARELAPPPRSSELLFVIEEGATFVRLADIEGDELKHGKWELSSGGGTASIVARIATDDVPAKHRVRAGQKLRVDDNCTATVTGFALVSRLTGDRGYAGIEDGDGEHEPLEWKVDEVLAHGDMFLAARIDGCRGGTYARAAALPAIVVLDERKDADLELAARSALLASPAAVETQKGWETNGGTGKWYDASTFTSKVLRHPGTGTTFVVTHALYEEMGCGGPNANLLGVFRVKKDGTVVTVGVRESELTTITKIIDVEGDGDLELIGSPWLGLDTMLIRAADGKQLDVVKLHFYGCPC